MPLQPNEVKTEHIANGAVTRDKIGEKQVSSSRLKDACVTTEKLVTGAVVASKIADAQVTTAKIKDSAVDSSKLAADSVTTKKILDGAVKTEKLAFRAITTPKIAAGAVGANQLATNSITTEKIANASVTPAKLSFTPPAVARPITPPVATAEIGDAQVTPAKLSFIPVARPLVPPIVAAELAGDSVETDKIKDGAVTPAKLSFVPGVTRPLVPPVATDEIAAGAVTEPKLADDILVDRMIESLFKRRDIFYDSFERAVLGDNWAESGDVGGWSSFGISGLMELNTTPVINKAWRISFGGAIPLSIWDFPKMTVRSIYHSIEVALRIIIYKDADNYIGFRADTSISPNWQTVTRSGGVETVTYTGTPISPGMVPAYELKIDVVSETQVKFYIDNVLKATHTTNIPIATFEPLIEIKTLAPIMKTLWLYKVFILKDKRT